MLTPLCRCFTFLSMIDFAVVRFQIVEFLLNGFLTGELEAVPGRVAY